MKTERDLELEKLATGIARYTNPQCHYDLKDIDPLMAKVHVSDLKEKMQEKLDEKPTGKGRG